MSQSQLSLLPQVDDIPVYFTNSAILALVVGFEMLEALRPGLNYTWTFGYQKTVSKNLQLSIQYLGRKSENTRIIHTGGMELRAFF